VHLRVQIDRLTISIGRADVSQARKRRDRDREEKRDGAHDEISQRLVFS
jgi:hypothetical protein